MASKTCNGYRNYQTWNVALWFANDESLYLHAKDARAVMPHGRFNRNRARDFVYDTLPNGTPDLQDRRMPYYGVDWQAVSAAFNTL